MLSATLLDELGRKNAHGHAMERGQNQEADRSVLAVADPKFEDATSDSVMDDLETVSKPHKQPMNDTDQSNARRRCHGSGTASR